MEFLLKNETIIRLAGFISVFFIMTLFEFVFPKKIRAMPRKNRWLTNITLVVINTLLLRLCIPILAVDLAWWCSKNNIGVLNLFSFPTTLNIVLTILLLDMFIYLQHVASHKLPILWRFHKIHHADRDIDATTGIRFHPIEIILSMLFKLFCVSILGANVVGVILFGVILNASAMFNHANISLAKWLDHKLRLVIITPDVHRVHHSVTVKETDSNYGFFLSIWDRLFGTYINEPKLGHYNMTIGLAEYQTAKPNGLLWCLFHPLKRKTSSEKT